MAQSRDRDALEGFLAPFTEQLAREENRAALRSYVGGLEADIPRKTATGIASVDNTTNAQRLQEFLTRTPWDPAVLDRQRVGLLGELATRPPGVLAIGTTSIRKRGSRSVGVARQSLAGERPINRQVLVTLSYADRAFEWPVAAELFLPPRWRDPKARDAAGVPEDFCPRSVPELAIGQLEGWAELLSPERLVLATPAFSPEELAPRLRERGFRYLLELPPGKGGNPGALEGRRLEKWWERGAGPRVREVARLRLDDAEDWLLAVRKGSEGGDGAIRWFQASPDLTEDEARSLLPLVGVAGRLEEEARRDFGLADYEGRLWSGLHNHLALVRLAQAHELLENAHG